VSSIPSSDGSRTALSGVIRLRRTAHTGGDEQQNDQHVLKLREEPPPRRDRLLSRELVAAVPFKMRSDLGVVQATLDIGATLDEAVLVMGRHQLGHDLDAEQVRVVVAFLGALTGELPESARMPTR
jgi:hypothetical protein